MTPDALDLSPLVHGSSYYDYGWTESTIPEDDLCARLVDVKPIEKGE